MGGRYIGKPRTWGHADTDIDANAFPIDRHRNDCGAREFERGPRAKVERILHPDTVAWIEQ